jgi:NhaP-type Na+/H+ and K+/H+ antiporter
MNTMLIFMAVCLILGLWVKPKVRSGIAIIAVAALILVIYFWLRPQQL